MPCVTNYCIDLVEVAQALREVIVRFWSHLLLVQGDDAAGKCVGSHYLWIDLHPLENVCRTRRFCSFVPYFCNPSPRAQHCPQLSEPRHRKRGRGPEGMMRLEPLSLLQSSVSAGPSCCSEESDAAVRLKRRRPKVLKRILKAR